MSDTPVTIDGSRALRQHVALSRSAHTLPVRVSGPDTFAALEWLCASDLHVRDGRMLHSVVLDEDGVPRADLFVCADDEDCILLIEGLSFAALQALLREWPGDAPADLILEDLSVAQELLALDGPYAFELLSDVLGPDVLGLPYASFFAVAGGHCFRAGKTGEYGYLLLLDRAVAEPTYATLRERLPRYDGREVTVADLDLAALENGFFSLRHAPAARLTALELQLSWRVSRGKSFRGRDAVLARPPDTRLTHFVAPAALSPGDPVELDGEPVGEVHACAFSGVVGAFVGLARLRVAVAHPGVVARGVVAHEKPACGVPLATLSAPVLRNRSLYVNPRESRYAARAELTCPAILPERLVALVERLTREAST